MGVDPTTGLQNSFSEVAFRMVGVRREEEGGSGLRYAARCCGWSVSLRQGVRS